MGCNNSDFHISCTQQLMENKHNGGKVCVLPVSSTEDINKQHVLTWSDRSVLSVLADGIK